VVSDILDAGVSTPGRAVQRLSRIPHSGYQDFLTAAERSLRYNLNRCRQIKRSGRTSRPWPTSAEPAPRRNLPPRLSPWRVGYATGWRHQWKL